ncbi:MAG: CPBP family intramembrane metalloprotease [Defluviitaleaceae bacterium]|nr:CPBP family intramembrane metalloprotease [Defluviitaleaceae bacterium]
MPKFSTRYANNFICLSILLGNALAFWIFFAVGYLSEITGELGTGLVRMLMQPGVVVIISQMSIMLIPFFVYLAVTKQKVSDVLPLKPLGPLNIFLITLITLTIMPLAMLLGGISTMLFGNSVADFVETMRRTNLGFTFVILAIVPSIFEEISLRGVVLSNYRNIDAQKAALVNGFFFGMIHLNPSQFLYAFLLGYMFALMVYYTRSIFAAMYGHFIFNGTQLLQFHLAQEYIQQQMIHGEALPDIGSQEMMLASLLTFAIIAAIFTPVAVILFKSFKGVNRRNFLKEELGLRPLEGDGTADHGGLAVSTVGSAGDDIGVFDSARVQLPEIPPEAQHHHGDQRIVTTGFVFTIVIYIVYVLFVFIL